MAALQTRRPGETKLSRDETRTLHVLGYLFLRMGKYARARRLFAAMAALDPSDIYARLCLAHACIKTQDGDAALHTLAGLSPDDPLPGGEAALHLLTARAQSLLGKSQAALDALNSYLKSCTKGGSQ